jgi:hypothetical protein
VWDTACVPHTQLQTALETTSGSAYALMSSAPRSAAPPAASPT